jgi:hypothetical protein
VGDAAEVIRHLKIDVSGRRAAHSERGRVGLSKQDDWSGRILNVWGLA